MGLRPRDIILEVEGQPVLEVSDLLPIIGGYAPGTRVTLALLRKGERLQKTVTLGAPREAR